MFRLSLSPGLPDVVICALQVLTDSQLINPIYKHLGVCRNIGVVCRNDMTTPIPPLTKKVSVLQPINTTIEDDSPPTLEEQVPPNNTIKMPQHFKGGEYLTQEQMMEKQQQIIAQMTTQYQGLHHLIDRTATVSTHCKRKLQRKP